MWGFDPPGSPCMGLPPCYAINFEEIPSCFVLNVYLWLLSMMNGPNTTSNTINNGTYLDIGENTQI